MKLRVRSVVSNPSSDELRAMTESQPTARLTEYDNYNITTQVTARSKLSTFIVADDLDVHTDPTITRYQFDGLARAQDDYLIDREVILIDGYIGDHPDARVRTRLVMDSSQPNIAAMQRLLFFPAHDDEEPELTVIYTPGLEAPGFPDDRVIAVDLANGVTRVLNSDYFGESKMGGLRMWDAMMYRRGGLAMHAGLKVVGEGEGRLVGLIVGLSGTGKTTTTFSRAGGGAPVQDDFVALYPGGKVYGTEAGTFAKVFGLTPESEPAVWQGALARSSYLENVAQDDQGRLDFGDRRHTENSRAVISADDIPVFLAPRNVDTADFVLILNRNANIIPAVAKLSTEQAAAYFMLGETQGTSAGGKAEAGKFLRVPGTNPFFAYRHEWQANRLHEILQTCELDVYLLNTGRVGGPDEDERSRKVTPEISGTIVAALAAGRIAWAEDPDFGYLVAAEVPGVDDVGLLQPAKLYESQGRTDEYTALVKGLKADRAAHMAAYRDLLPEIAAAV